MANKKITDLMSGTPVRDSLLESAIDISGTMDSRKVKAGLVADLASANVASPYDDTTTYAIGQYCLYEGDIYRCIAITTGAFDSTAWTQIVVTGEFRRVVELTSAQYTALSSAEKNNGTLYIITDEETTAGDIPYDNTVSGLTADDLQEAVDEVSGKVDDKANKNDFIVNSVSRANISVPANDINTITFTVNNSKLNIITGYSISASSYVIPVQIFFVDSTTIQVRLKNTVNNADTCSVTIYYI